MSINGIGANYYQSNISKNKHNRSNAGQFYQQKQVAEASAFERTRQNANIQEFTLKKFAEMTGAIQQVDRQEAETKTEIIAKPDGSRVLVMTMSIGGMETTMSLEISKPTEAPNENSKQDNENNMPSADAEMDTVSDEMSNISTEA